MALERWGGGGSVVRLDEDQTCLHMMPVRRARLRLFRETGNRSSSRVSFDLDAMLIEHYLSRKGTFATGSLRAFVARSR